MVTPSCTESMASSFKEASAIGGSSLKLSNLACKLSCELDRRMEFLRCWICSVMCSSTSATTDSDVARKLAWNSANLSSRVCVGAPPWWKGQPAAFADSASPALAASALARTAAELACSHGGASVWMLRPMSREWSSATLARSSERCCCSILSDICRRSSRLRMLSSSATTAACTSESTGALESTFGDVAAGASSGAGFVARSLFAPRMSSVSSPSFGGFPMLPPSLSFHHGAR
mmetsp:Transcript_601/g.2378  ORF Transcript_601/g.2378 Transcript_601/m.2378 type:complete len:234 (+) Transcript_601:2693-3394(+)